jgi:hypothetical protein
LSVDVEQGFLSADFVCDVSPRRLRTISTCRHIAVLTA